MRKSRLGEKSCGVATKASKVARALCPLLGLAFCLQLAFAQQRTQQPPPRVGEFGGPVKKAAPPQVPTGSRPPDLGDERDGAGRLYGSYRDS